MDLFLMDYDAATAKNRAFTDRPNGARVDLIIVVYGILLKRLIVVPNLDSEPIDAPSAVDLAIDGCEEKVVAPQAVNGTDAFVLSTGSRHHQPRVSVAAKVQVCSLKPKFGIPGWNTRSLFILGNEAKVGSPFQGRIGRIGPSR